MTVNTTVVMYVCVTETEREEKTDKTKGNKCGYEKKKRKPPPQCVHNEILKCAQ